jgi:hypothetical protein
MVVFFLICKHKELAGWMDNTTSACDSVIRGNAEKRNFPHFSVTLAVSNDMRLKQDGNTVQFTIIAFDRRNCKLNN